MNKVRATGWRSPWRKTVGISMLAIVGLLLGGCNAYPQSVFQLHSDFAIAIQDLFDKIIWAAIAVFVVVEGVLFYTVLRYRRRPNDALPQQIHGHARLEVAWTLIPALILGFIAVPTVQTIFKTQAPAPANAMLIDVVAHQWWWEFEYPEYGIRTANEIHMPVGRPVNLQMRSADVIHSFWIPALGGKRDVVPQHTNYLWWTATTPGTYLGQCAEFCGDSHANMRMRAVVQTPADFDAWVQQQKQPAPQPTAGDAATGAQLFQQKGCAGCHTIAGTPAAGRTAPDLSHVGSRTTIAGGTFPNEPDAMRAWLLNPPGQKPGALMPNLGLSQEEANALVAYLESLK